MFPSEDKRPDPDALLAHIEAVAVPEATSYLLFTGARSADNIRMYRRAGYTDIERYNDNPYAGFWFEKTVTP